MALARYSAMIGKIFMGYTPENVTMTAYHSGKQETMTIAITLRNQVE
jgi:hypothetical protein